MISKVMTDFSLISAIDQLKTDQAEIEETGGKIILPVKALNLLGEILKP